MKPAQLLLTLSYLLVIALALKLLLRAPLRRAALSRAAWRTAPVDLTRTGGRRAAGMALGVLAVMVAVTGLVLCIWVTYRWESSSPGQAVFATFAAMAVLMWRESRQMLALSAEQVRERDPRSPILFLRPFKADREMHEREIPMAVAPLLPALKTYSLRATLEEKLARAFVPYGPFIGLHDQALRRPFPGAARLLVDDSRWQQVVTEYLHESHTVILLVAQVTESYSWEIHECVRVLAPQWLVLVLPKRPNGTSDDITYQEFRSAAGSAFPGGLPDVLDEDALLLVFEADWTPVCIAPRHPEYMHPLTDCVQSYMSMRARSGVWHRPRGGAPSRPSLIPPPAPPSASFELASPAATADGQPGPANVRFHWP